MVKVLCFTYGDGVSNININDLIKFHKKSGKLVTLTSVKTPERFGNLDTNEQGTVIHFEEKPDDGGMWINGGFFVIETGIFKYLDGDMDDVQWEKRASYQYRKRRAAKCVSP